MSIGSCGTATLLCVRTRVVCGLVTSSKQIEMRSLCVFCGSNLGARDTYRAAAEGVGRELASRGLRLVYGGTSVGLMGAMADASLAAGGKVVGVLARVVADREIAHPGLTECHLVDSMHERKAKMADLADAFLALPGGYGTLDEMFETLTWSQLGLQRKPCAFLNVAGYFDPLFRFLDAAVKERFVRPEHRAIALTGTDAVALLDSLAAWHSDG